MESVLHEKNIKIFARFNHGKEARDVNLQLADTEVLVFGDPKVGTFLMQDDISIAIELPLKILAWQTDAGTKIAYQNPELIAQPYSINTHAEIIHKMKDFMHIIVTIAVGK